MISDRTGDAVLVVPPACQSQACPLIIVSHGREGSPASELHQFRLERFFQRLGEHGFVLLFSEDGGAETWGNDAALDSVKRAFHKAGYLYQGNGGVYTLGISMGGLTATLTAYRQTLGMPVGGVALLAGRVNLRDAYQGPPGRAMAIDEAYGGQQNVREAVAHGHDPVNDFASFAGNRTPVFAVLSREDTTVTASLNGELLVRLGQRIGVSSRFFYVVGAHLAPAYFSTKTAEEVARFFSALERVIPTRPRPRDLKRVDAG